MEMSSRILCDEEGGVSLRGCTTKKIERGERLFFLPFPQQEGKEKETRMANPGPATST